MKKMILVVVLLFLLVCIVTGCESWDRAMKSAYSDLSGGLNRTVTVYSYNGEPIKSWEGKFDTSDSETETWFDIDGRRVIIQGGIVINEETEK